MKKVVLLFDNLQNNNGNGFLSQYQKYINTSTFVYYTVGSMSLSKIELWNNFCGKYKILETGVPLFDNSNGTVSSFSYGLDKRYLLKRSSSMENLVIREVEKVLEDYHRKTNEYEGLIYMMYWIENQQVMPLYIGKSEKFGKKDSNLSANIKNIRSNNSFFVVGDIIMHIT